MDNKILSDAIYTGHAGFLMYYNSVSLLCDPWFSYSGAMLNAWHQFPDNSFLLKINKDLFQPDYVWVSHEHDDHYDLEFLEKIPKTTKIILPKFPSNRIPNQLTKMGFNDLFVLGDGESLALDNDFSVCMLFEEPHWTEHSSLVIRLKDICILHNSDSYLTDLQLIKIKERYSPQIYIGQFSATSPFPNIMKDWDETKKKPFRRRHLDWALDRFTNSVTMCGAQISIPCAGPAINLDEKRIESTKLAVLDKNGALNYNFLFNRLKDELPNVDIKFMKIGQSIFNNDINNLPRKEESLSEIEKIVHNKKLFLNIKLKSVDVADIVPHQKKVFDSACILAPYIVTKIKSIFSIYLIDNKQRIDTYFIHNKGMEFPKILIKSGKGNRVKEWKDEEYYQIQLHSSIWNDFIKTKILFDEIFYSQRQEIVESKCGFSSDLINLLRCVHDKNILKAANKDLLKVNNELTDVFYKKQKYKISKYCPHLGTSLESVEVDNKGIITCPAHKWKFSIKNGKCVSHDKTQSIKSIPYKV